MKSPLTALLLLVPLLFSGCFYEAPISEEPSRELDKMLLGEWTVSDSPTGKLVITEVDAKTYSVLYQEPKEGDAKPEILKFQGYHTTVGSKELVSLQLVEPEGGQKGKWLYVAYTLPEAGRLEIKSVNSKVVPFPPSADPKATGGEKLVTAEAMEAFMETVVDKPDFLNPEPLVFLKAK